MKLLTFTSLYPSAARPLHGIFVEARLRQMLKCQDVESVAVAPVPWVPFGTQWSGRFASLAATPLADNRHGIPVHYPRFLPLPGLQGALKPWFMAAAAIPVIKRLRASGYAFDLVDAHYFYPDGVAAAIVARYFGVPVAVTARGTDLNYHARQSLPRRLILWAARRAAAVLTVSSALRDVAVSLGIDPARISVSPNGVDAQLFRPMERAEVRRQLGLDGLVLLSVGNLIPEKGHDLVIRALGMLPDASLLVAGDGPQRAHLARLASEAGVSSRVVFLGSVPQSKLVEYYNAADVLVLASSREGWPNVLLEAMACGTPVVAAHVGGCGEIVATPEAGTLLTARTPEAIVEAVSALRRAPPERAQTRRYAEKHSWTATCQRQVAIYRAILDGGMHEPAVHCSEGSVGEEKADCGASANCGPTPSAG